MASVSHQTIKLDRGSHNSPAEGACVMELASMLAGEPFSDHPESVCPVIASFLRVYNDSLPDERRQDLYGLAAMVVGTRATKQVQQARSHHLALWSWQMRERRRTRFVPRDVARALRLLAQPPSGMEPLATYAVRSVRHLTDEMHAAVLALVEELVAIGARKRPERVRGAAREPIALS